MEKNSLPSTVVSAFDLSILELHKCCDKPALQRLIGEIRKNCHIAENHSY